VSHDHDRPAMIAMGAAASSPAMRCPSRDEAPASARRPAEPGPAVDERLVMPGTRYEILDGRLLFTPPADEAHGSMHLDLAAVLRAQVTAEYRGAVDMLTRTREVGDHAPDASIYPQERDAVTGGRKLEELAFEIVSEQAMSVPTGKARDYLERGVRRVFCIDVGKRRVLECSRSKADWEELARDASIADACFVRPLPVRALLDAALVDDTVAEGLLAKKNRVLEAAIAKGEARGETRGEARGELKAKAQGLLQAFAVRKIAATEADRACVLACSDPAQLDLWMSRALVATRREEVFGDGE
jgi:Uma2 family endonuclease